MPAPAYRRVPSLAAEWSRRSPVLDRQAWNTAELPEVAGYQSGAERPRMGGNQEVVAPDGLTGLLCLGTDLAV